MKKNGKMIVIMKRRMKNGKTKMKNKLREKKT